MTVAAMYANDLSRVRLSITGAPAQADYALVERSTDQVTWVTVRGGDTVPLSAGAGKLDDYEFTPGVPNYYRASYVDSGAITSVGITSGGPVTGNNTSLNPALPAGLAAGDLLLLVASIRNSGTGTVNTPAGWTDMVTFANVKVMGRRYVTGDTAPTVTFAGGAAGASTTAVIWAIRNAELVPATQTSQFNASAQNVAYPALTSGGSGDRLSVLIGWKQAQPSTWTTPAGMVAVTSVNNTQGSGDSLTVFLAAYPTTVASGAITVTGGAAAISRALLFALAPAAYVTRDTVTITPAITQVWLKNPRRANLNTPIGPVKRIQIERKARMGVFDIISRTLPIAVTDLRGPREFVLNALVEDPTERDRLDLILAAGDPILLHTPPGSPVGSLYAVIGDTAYTDEDGIYQLPLTEVAAPPATVYSITSVWGDIVAAYATWSDVMAAEPQWADVLDYVAPAGNIVVP